MRWHIAVRLLQQLREFHFKVYFAGLIGELDNAASVLEDLGGFNTRHFIKKPTAAGIHEHGVALHFHDSQYLVLVRTGSSKLLQKLLNVFVASLSNDANVFVSCLPGLFKDAPALFFKDHADRIAEPI